MIRVDGFSCRESVVAAAGGEERMAEHVAAARVGYAAMAPWVPATVNEILDIGCGLAVIDVLIARGLKRPALHLMDGVGEGAPVKFDDNPVPWGDVRAGAAFVADNTGSDVVDELTVHLPDPAATIRVDLLLSLKSWGHHYPVGVYLPLALRSTVAGARLVLDIRKGTNGLAELERAGFGRLATIGETPKCHRHVLERL